MTTQDWNRVWELFRQARDLHPEQRLRLLDESTAEPHILEEVQAMLDTDESEPEPPAPGRQYGRYTLVAPLGAGGMGEVFSARDADLGRLVAIKFLGAKSTIQPAAIERLVREAQTASSLNHPNLVTIHEVLRFDAGIALVAELVNGQALRTFCGVGCPIPQVAGWGAQIARGLAAAHAESIVHGDIKPENVMLRKDGYIKILDFGIAQQNAVRPGSTANMLLGTLGYMSPEQTRGEPLSGLSDIFSLGVVLLELATGHHPFMRSTASSTTAAINQQEAEIPVHAIRGGQSFARLLQTMLAKDSAQRPEANVVAERLEQIATGAKPSLNWMGVAGLAIMLAGGAVWWWMDQEAARTVKLTSPEAITRYNGIEQQPSLSPDGTRMLFVWSGFDGNQDDVYMRSVRGEDIQRITSDRRREFSPVWSPDGHSIAWQRRALDGGNTEILVAAVNGSTVGTARVAGSVIDHDGYYGLAWWPDSGSVVTRDRGPGGYPLVRISLADGSKTFLTSLSETQDYHPALSPDHQRMLFLRWQSGHKQICRLELIGVSKEVCLTVADALNSVAWLANSRSVLYSVAQTLWQVNLEVGARPRRVMEGDFAGLTASADGRTFLFSRTITDSNIWRLDVATHKSSLFIASSEEDSEPHFSPDGVKVLFRSKRTGVYELYVCNRDGTGLRQLTSLGGHLGSGRWSPDGRWIAFDTAQDSPGPAGRATFENIHVMPGEGGPIRRLTANDTEHIVPGWSADSQWLYYIRGTPRETWKVPLAGGSPVKMGDHEMFDLEESADGEWIWYELPTVGKGLWRRARSGGPEQRISGTEDMGYRNWEIRNSVLYFVRGGSVPGIVRLSLAGGKAGPMQVIGDAPRRLFHGPRSLSVSPDGKAILYTAEDLTIGDIFLMRLL